MALRDDYFNKAVETADVAYLLLDDPDLVERHINVETAKVYAALAQVYATLATVGGNRAPRPVPREKGFND